MTDPAHGALGPGDRAPDFELPAGDSEGTVALAEYRRRGPVLLTLLRGLYCAFCRRHISQFRPTCETLRAKGIALLGVVIASPERGIALLGVVIASPERSRRYFGHFPPCFPIAAAPDRATHRAYGLSEVIRTPELRQETERSAAEILRELGLQAPPGQATAVFDASVDASDGFEMTAEDDAEWKRPLQSVGYFLIGRDGLIRWSRVEARITTVPAVEELLALV
jgi:hypothetical protein